MHQKIDHEPSRQEIWKMFDGISHTYDLVNRVMTLGLDTFWRKKMASYLPQQKEIHLLDLATGTADQLIALMESSPHIVQAVGVDLAQEMIRLGVEKLKAKPYAAKVLLQEASALNLPFDAACFDCVTISFGIRNVTDVHKCLSEMFRVLKKGGKALILEGSLPSNKGLRAAHLFYLRHMMPRIGGWISKQKHAYHYLNRTIETFPSGKAFCDLLIQAGFSQAIPHPLSGGMVTIYEGTK
jgi:demethylmenaquinone methyltransferase/2-methoxy-6-polyprenyl-1,4-benzoquinol methylase